jgi:hypothetical protein
MALLVRQALYHLSHTSSPQIILQIAFSCLAMDGEQSDTFLSFVPGSVLCQMKYLQETVISVSLFKLSLH